MDHRHLLDLTNMLNLSNKHNALKATLDKISDYKDHNDNLIWTILISFCQLLLQ